MLHNMQEPLNQLLYSNQKKKKKLQQYSIVKRRKFFMKFINENYFRNLLIH